MDIIHFPDDPRPARWHQPVLAFGNFDGLHRGHAKIIDRVRRRADERGWTASALTFDPHPPRVVRPEKAPPLLMTKDQRLDALAQAGMQGVAIVRFTPELSRWEPERFVHTVLVEWLRVTEVWVGANFLFGRDRSGNFSLLRALGARYGFRAERIDPVRYKEFVVSSTRIRRLISEGRVDEAGALLGHHYFIDGTVMRGEGRGGPAGISDGESEHGQRAAPAARGLCVDRHDRWRHTPVGDQRRRAADVRRWGTDRGRDASVQFPSGDVRGPASPRVHQASAGRTGVSHCGRAGRADRHGLPAGQGAVRPDFAVRCEGRCPRRCALA